ncbi:MAG: hypothetical protein KKF44_01355 [Nanoarchaeota archaeon]|nr:hypothetical protein [Nanoarchaeota archaeon]
MKTNNKTRKAENALLEFALFIVIIAFLVNTASGVTEPTGASLTYKSNSTKNATVAGNRSDAKGTITTVILNSIQQNYKWKAYVGNISSTFTLDDESDYTIYQWSIDEFTGEILATRATTAPTWGSVNCSSIANKQSEDTALGHTSTNADSINSTFATQTHKEFDLAGNTILESSCFATATWINDSVNTLTTTASFQEVLLHDGTNLIYTTFVENDKIGYRNDSVTTYDFQMILAENASSTAPDIQYYFYVELA